MNPSPVGLDVNVEKRNCSHLWPACMHVACICLVWNLDVNKSDSAVSTLLFITSYLVIYNKKYIRP